MTLPWHLPVVLGAVLLAPAGATLTLTPGTPTVVLGTVISPAGATLSLTGGIPSVVAGSAITPPGASLTLTGGTPNVVQGTVVTPAGATLTLTPGTPGVVVTGPVNITPAGATLTLTGGTPVLTTSINISPAGGTLTLTGGTPQVILPTGPISPDAGVLALYPGTPTLTIAKYFDSFRVAAISMADYVQPVFTGTGARMYRATGSTVNPVLTVAGTPALLPANTFDTIDIATADITVDLTNGGFTVSTPGWYRVVCRLQSSVTLSSASTTPSAFGVCLYKNGTALRLGVAAWGVQVSGAPFILGPDSIFGDFDIELAVGDAVQLGNWVDTANMQNTFHIEGDSIGGATYASITLNNRAA
jgi:hypothetical protein